MKEPIVDTIEIAGRAVPLEAWAIAQQLYAAFQSTRGTESELKTKHEFAFAVHAGMLAAKRREPALVQKLVSLQQQLDVVSDELRNLARRIDK